MIRVWPLREAGKGLEEDIPGWQKLGGWQRHVRTQGWATRPGPRWVLPFFQRAWIATAQSTRNERASHASFLLSIYWVG